MLTPWQNLYVIVGSSASALTGLVFIVITIVNGGSQNRRSHEGTAAYTTPTIVHFGAALFTAAVLSVPWPALRYAAVILALCGLYGIAYVWRTAYRIQKMSAYDADIEDWLCHTFVPLLAYGALFAGAVALWFGAALAMFAFAFTVVALIFTGIHNAWDIVVFLAVANPDEAQADSSASEPAVKEPLAL